ncbi:chondroitin sulfate glucuronyltransferase [Coccinella septempunctata]|uniref:chondroitin sulfate glucuronyltransferase n=1 Tax=Coccinella septempunctata TaxID=41139 RepID=UPI001D0977DA|nr:chondroitin sulfate glucuronyltransferase [Coccinella septempunctata]
MVKNLKRLISNNIFLILGFLIGVYMQLSYFSIEFVCDSEIKNIVQDVEAPQADKIIAKPPIINVTKTNSTDAKKKKKLIRPRYYSTELGIREKLFVGIYTSEEKVNTQAIHINKTVAHLVDKIKFFITAQYKLKSKFNLTGLVGFTDTRSKYRPFQIFKYIGDNFGQEYDYYLLATDYTYLNVHRIKDIVNAISVSMDVYLGTKESDSSFCSLDAGIIISNSVLKAVREKLDWCVLNAVSDSHSENIGRCIYNSIGLNCQETVQSQRLTSFRMKHFDLDKSLYNLSRREDFNSAATVYPVLQGRDFYQLNTHFIKQRLNELQGIEKELAEGLVESWPPGHKPKAKPATRFDLARQLYFNLTHVFFPDDFTTIRKHNKDELSDIQNILNRAVEKALIDNKNLTFTKLSNGYKTFDASRGMDYVIDVEFLDEYSSKVIKKRFEICKPLSKVEFVPVPYVTENKKVTVFLVIQEHEVKEAKTFLNNFLGIMNDKKDQNFLMLILFYQNNSISQGKNDVFLEVKNFVKKTSALFKDETKVAWVSIRLPTMSYVASAEVKSLNFVAVDLALKKVGVNNLILILDSFCNITKEFLNRVRMNTIEKFQVFSPIPFRQYNPKASEYSKFEVNKNAGHFDREEYKYISFYGRDYVEARKKYQQEMPIIRADTDIATVLKEPFRSRGNLLEMFVETLKDFRHMRATEMNLLIRYHEELDQGKCNKFIGSKSQLAKLLLSKKSEIPLLQ